MPDKICSTSRIRIRSTDLNYGNHLGNDRILVYVQEARVEWLSSLGYTELNLEGIGLIMADAMVQFKGEGFLHDEVMIEVAVVNLGPRSFDLYYRLYTVRNAVNVEIAAVKTAMIAFDYTAKKVALLAEKVIGILLPFSNEI